MFVNSCIAYKLLIFFYFIYIFIVHTIFMGWLLRLWIVHIREYVLLPYTHLLRHVRGATKKKSDLTNCVHVNIFINTCTGFHLNLISSFFPLGKFTIPRVLVACMSEQMDCRYSPVLIYIP